MIICSTFLFFALVEFAIVLLIRRYEENRKIREDEQGKTKEEKDAMQDELRTKAWSQLTKEEKKKMNLKKWYMAKVMGKFDDLAYKIDKICLIIFMILFFLYNLVYYLLNTTFQDVEGEEE